MGNAPTFLPEGYKNSAEISTEETDKATILTTKHFDGSVDKMVKVKSIRLQLTDGATPDKHHIAAIAELEAASKEHMLAKNSNSEEWLRYTTRRLKAANVRLLEVQ